MDKQPHRAGVIRRVSTLLEILVELEIAGAQFCFELFQPFLRFWPEYLEALYIVRVKQVSTLLEILAETTAQTMCWSCCPAVSTLLEILGIVCLIVVGF